MPLELPEAHARSLDATRAFVAGVRADEWDRESVCGEWDVRALVNHIVGGNLWVVPLVDGGTIDDVGDRFDGDLLGTDPLAAYDASAAPAAAAFRGPQAMEAPVAVSYGPVPGEVYCGHRFVDVLVHGWDVAASTGQSADLDPELVTVALAVLEPQIDMLSGSGMFGTRRDAGEGASDHEQLLAMLGRA